MVNIRKKKVKEGLKEMDFSHIEDVARDLIDDIMSKDWREMLSKEIQKIKNPKKSNGKAEGISMVAAFAIGYMLGSLRRR